MNNDDTFQTNDNHHPALTPELEARVVAWVLGEASPFEATVLELLCAEHPELAVFKRRIEAVHGLVGEAAKPVAQPLTLSPERRAKVLAVIGAEQSVPGAPAGQGLPAPAKQPRRKQRRTKLIAWRRWTLQLAACLTVMAGLAAVMIPTVGKVQRAAYRTAKFSASGEGGKQVYEMANEEQDHRMVENRMAGKAMSASGSSDTGQVAAYADSTYGGGTTVSAGLAALDATAPMVSLPNLPAAPVMGFRNAGKDVVDTAVASSSSLSQRQAPAGFLGGSGASENKKEDAPFSSPETVTITAGVPQTFTVRNGTEWGAPSVQTAPAADPFSAPVAGEARGNISSLDDAARSKLAAKGRSEYLAGDLDGSQKTFRALEADAPASPVAKSFLERIAKEKASLGELKSAKQRAAKMEEVTNAWQRPGVYVTDGAKAQREVAKPKPAQPPFDESVRAEIATAAEAVSTFSLHVSDTSVRLAKAALSRGEAPDPSTIRPEEFYNAFDYGDPAPVVGEPVSCRIEQAAHPFLQQRNLVRIAMKVPAAGRGAGTPLRLTVLLDTSGSMEREDRAATVRSAFAALASLLGPNDRVTLVGFARTPRLLAESVPGDQAGKLIELAAHTPAEGGTNLEEALALAGNLALRQKLAGAQNRIVLLTDGAANLGDADPQQLAKRVESLREKGIAFDACGVVADGLDDTVLEALTRKGDGRYTLINSPEEADATFARQLAGAFRPAAKDVKVQVHFNPARVARYRLIGFEQHRLKTEDFRNDAVDAAELAAEEAAVAVYQVEVRPEGEGELGEVSVRFLDTHSNEHVERSWTLGYAAQPAAFARATPSLQLAGSAAFLAEKLRGGALAGQIRLEEFAPVVEGLGAAYPQAVRVREFVEMFRQTRRLTGE